MRFAHPPIPRPFSRVRRATAARALALGFLAVGTLSGSVGAAGDDGVIDDGRYESPNFEYEVEWSRPWDVDPAETFSEKGFDVLALTSGVSYIAVMGTTAEVTPEESLDGWIEQDSERYLQVELYDQGDKDGIAYATYAGESDEGTIVIHVEIREIAEADRDDPAVHLVAMLFAAEEDYEDDFASAIDDVEIDGEAVFLMGFEREDEADRDDEDAKDDDRDADAEEDDDDRRSGRVSADGVIDDYTYESPSYGYLVEWDDPWTVDPNSTVSEPRSDELGLINGDGGDLWIVSMPAIGTPEEVVDAMLDSVAQQLDDDEVVAFGEADGVAYATIVGSDGADTLVFYVEVRELEDGVLLLTNLMATEVNFDRNLLSATEEVEIDGDPIFLATEAEDDAGDDRDRDDEDAENDDDRDQDRDDEDEDRDQDRDDEDDEDDERRLL